MFLFKRIISVSFYILLLHYDLSSVRETVKATRTNRLKADCAVFLLTVYINNFRASFSPLGTSYEECIMLVMNATNRIAGNKFFLIRTLNRLAIHFQR